MTESASPVGPGVTLSNWRTEQFLRWSLQHAREFLPTARVARAGPIAELLGTPGSLASSSLASVSLADGNGAATTVGAVIASTYTDGFLVMYHGRVVMEEYLAGMTAGTAHAVMSVTKSMVGCVAAVLIARSAVLLGLGIHGQMVYVNTAANMVGVKLSSWPVPQDPVMLSATLRAFDAITTHLAASGAPIAHLRRRDRKPAGRASPFTFGMWQGCRRCSRCPAAPPGGTRDHEDHHRPRGHRPAHLSLSIH
jgi:CubicO group peptidase (beta-lactamase class C family)